jgi:hypothetical protein
MKLYDISAVTNFMIVADSPEEALEIAKKKLSDADLALPKLCRFDIDAYCVLNQSVKLKRIAINFKDGEK